MVDVLIVIGTAMILMTAVFTFDTESLDILCQAIWGMLHDPRFWTIAGWAWGGVLVALGFLHLGEKPEDKL